MNAPLIPERYKELHRIGQMYGSVYLPSTILFELGAAESQIRELAHDRTVAVDTNAVLVESIESLQAQLRQEREAHAQLREEFVAGYGEYKRAQEMCSQLIEDRDTWMGQAKRANLQVAQLQTTVGQLREVLRKCARHAPTCSSWSRPNKSGDNPCDCGLDAALATCPAPAKENE